MPVPRPYSPEVAVTKPPAEKETTGKFGYLSRNVDHFCSGLRIEPATRQPVEQTQVYEKTT